LKAIQDLISPVKPLLTTEQVLITTQREKTNPAEVSFNDPMPFNIEEVEGDKCK
jgi:hypothetical protein